MYNFSDDVLQSRSGETIASAGNNLSSSDVDSDAKSAPSDHDITFEPILTLEPYLFMPGYIAYPKTTGVLLIQTKRAIERIHYDQLLDAFNKKAMTTQKLLHPITFSIAMNDFGFELFRLVYGAEKEHENMTLSPLSVNLALAMTYNGANGETKTAMEKTLKVYGLTPDDINKSYFDLVNSLKSLDPKVLLEIANAIFYRNDFAVENNFVNTNRQYYNAEISALDFNSPQAVNTDESAAP